MSILTRFFEWFYAWMLRLYPAGFRNKFGGEMQDDFQSALAETQKPGGEQIWQLILARDT